MSMHVHYTLSENYVRTDKNMKKDSSDDVLKATWKAEKFM